MKTNLRLSRFILPVAAACLTGTVTADDYHYVNMLIGDRASGMGGAYTAISDDATGLYYNPAGTAYTRGRNISASVNAYHITNTSYKSVFGGGNWNRESSSLLPNFFGVLQPLGKGVAGFSYAVTDSYQENQAQHFTNLPETLYTNAIDDLIINTNNSDSTYKLGPSYAWEIGEGFSIGVSLLGHFRNTQVIMNQVLSGVAAPANYVWQNSYTRINEAGIEPLIGIMWNPADKLAFGASMRKTMVVTSDYRAQSSCVANYGGIASCTTTPSTAIRSANHKRAYPLHLSLGAAYFPSDRLLYSVDFNYYAKASGLDGESSSSPFRSKPATWNLSAGTEYYVSPNWAARGGIYTSRANTPAVSTTSTDQPDHVDLFGISASLSRFTRNSSITGGFAIASGTGKAQAISGVTLVQDATATATTLFLSTSYTF